MDAMTGTHLPRPPPGPDHRGMDRRYPVGPFTLDPDVTREKRLGWIAQLDRLPADMAAALDRLPPGGLEQPYRDGGWTGRQVVNHVADSHLNAYTRFKLALTEDNPTIKTYEEQLWAELVDGRTADPSLSLGILRGIHARLTMVLESLTAEQFARPAVHPSNGPTSIDGLLQMYAWHSRHHLGHLGLIGR
jgi:DinB superfamily